MKHTGTHHSALVFLLIGCLVVLLTACSGSPASGSSGTPTTSQASTPPAQTTSPTSTNCPATGSGRAAVINQLKLGVDQSLLYVYQDTSTSTITWRLRRFDARTGLKSDIYTTQAGHIEDAQVSQDGQWVLFLLDFYPAMRTQASAEIQMIRVDGKDLQTLYCFAKDENYSKPANGSAPETSLPVGLQLSPDQKSLLFSVDTGNNTSTMSDLNMASGQVQQVYQDKADTLYTTSLVTWLNNSNAYMLTQGRTQPAPAAKVLLLNIAASLSHANQSTTQVAQGGGHMRELSLDTSFDGTKLYTDDCLLAGSPYQTTIQVEPSQGGAAQMLYQPPSAICVDEIRVISSTTMLMLVTDRNASSQVIQHEIWTMSVTGKAQHGLTTLTPNDSTFQLNPNSQYVWSNISRDNSLYVLQQEEANSDTENLVYGSLNGGDVTTVASSSANTLTLVGWTTM